MSGPIFVGWTSKATEGWESYATEPQAAKNVTDPVKIREQIEKKQAEQRNTAHEHPVFGELANLCVLDLNGTILTLTESQHPAKTLGRLLRNRYPSGYQFGFSVFGFEIEKCLQITGMSLLHSGGTADRLPGHYWRFHAFSPRGVCDPYHYLLTTEARKDVSLQSLLKFLNIETAWCEKDLSTDPLLQAQLVLHLCKTAGLV